jgi:hypothetical protein
MAGGFNRVVNFAGEPSEVGVRCSTRSLATDRSSIDVISVSGRLLNGFLDVCFAELCHAPGVLAHE